MPVWFVQKARNPDLPGSRGTAETSYCVMTPFGSVRQPVTANLYPLCVPVSRNSSGSYESPIGVAGLRRDNWQVKPFAGYEATYAFCSSLTLASLGVNLSRALLFARFYPKMSFTLPNNVRRCGLFSTRVIPSNSCSNSRWRFVSLPGV